MRHLESLHLVGVYCNTPSCFDVLLRLLALRRLALTRCTHLPACLSRLSALEVLALEKAPLSNEAAAAELGPALAGLSSLSHLALRSMTFCTSGLPAEIARLPQLQRLFWVRDTVDYDVDPAPLPGGAWLSNLRCLVSSHLLRWLACPFAAARISSQLQDAFLLTLSLPLRRRCCAGP